MKRKPFLSDEFLLENEVAVLLYQQFASPLPILDYHNHLSPKDIAENRSFKNITEAWLEGDHYKWRAMRINGIAEEFCTGDASPSDKFQAWAKTVPYTLRNPLYHWTHLELKNYFGIRKLLNEDTAHEIYEECTAQLHMDEFRVQSLLAKMNVQVVCTTDDPSDNLEHHLQFAKHKNGLRMFPSFRPDKSYTTHDPIAYNNYLDLLSESAHVPINSFENLIDALEKRITFFTARGCKSADHGLEFLYFNTTASFDAPSIFKKIRDKKTVSVDEQLSLRCAILVELCKLYHRSGWVQQFHLGALRSTNSRLLQRAGSDSGFDSIGDFPQAEHMAKFFDYLDQTNQLAKTILYNSNPTQNEVFATMAGNFSDGSTPGKIQFGAGWWFMDQKDGMINQINTLSSMGLLSRFVGMVTDSRSFLSFPRHEYFRRILCNLIGSDVERGELPENIPELGRMVQDICYFNTKNFLTI